MEFAGKISRTEFLQRHGEIDLALDTFPYNGPTTSLDSLWMGVPVITRTGETEISRGTFSILSHLGLPELAAHSDDDYVRLAVELARDVDRLATLRASLRERFRRSLLTDIPRFTRQLEAAFLTMWRTWCTSSSPA
jgi:predicted O-linked N-acetylglucosamine transferase (SPINDLY family)